MLDDDGNKGLGALHWKFQSAHTHEPMLQHLIDMYADTHKLQLNSLDNHIPHTLH